MKKRKLKLQTEIGKHGGTIFSSEASRCVHELWPTDRFVSGVLQSFDGG